jgi:hypothetical protein
MERPKLICLTPVLNEAWILERFLKCTSLWADHIIIADQRSTDGSREIARRCPKVTLIDNRSEVFNEPERQQMLLAEARRIPGAKILLALDADEFLTANFLTSPEWETNSPGASGHRNPVPVAGHSLRLVGPPLFQVLVGPCNWICGRRCRAQGSRYSQCSNTCTIG